MLAYSCNPKLDLYDPGLDLIQLFLFHKRQYKHTFLKSHHISSLSFEKTSKSCNLMKFMKTNFFRISRDNTIYLNLRHPKSKSTRSDKFHLSPSHVIQVFITSMRQYGLALFNTSPISGLFE